MTPIIAERRDMVVKHETLPVPVKKAKPKADPSPSKLSYRWERLWLTHWFRKLVRVWMPLAAIILAAYASYQSPIVSGWVIAQYNNARAAVAVRPEMRIERVAIPVGSPDLQRQILGIMALELPVSALNVDLAELRDLVQGLNAVKTASVRYESGVLVVKIVERMPAMVWRNLNRIYLLDEDGVRVAEVPRRAVRADLQLVVGEGADLAMLEAREIYSIMTPIEDRVLGLVRMGTRRWDVVLQDKVISLPAAGGADALRALMNLQARHGILEKDASIIDMRNPNRMILRLNDEALNELRLARGRALGEPV